MQTNMRVYLALCMYYCFGFNFRCTKVLKRDACWTSWNRASSTRPVSAPFARRPPATSPAPFPHPWHSPQSPPNRQPFPNRPRRRRVRRRTRNAAAARFRTSGRTWCSPGPFRSSSSPTWPPCLSCSSASASPCCSCGSSARRRPRLMFRCNYSLFMLTL